ncbi:MAG: HAD-IIIA family hydrolase [Archangiaceae bacterium]|nr:HAD-IIIA family hydrolase [Archangiaceae bacterium]
MQCVVLAGGLATRMRPLTEKIPKVLLEVEGQAFLHYQLALLAAQGVDDVVLSLGYRAEQVEQWLHEHPPPPGMKVRCVVEREPLGTAGALRECFDQGVLDDTFFLTWGDSFLPFDWRPVWAAFRGEALMTVLENAGRWDTSNVVFRDGALRLYDKTRSGAPTEEFRHIDYGLMVLRRSVVEGIAPGRADLAELFRSLSREGRLQGFEVRKRFYEIGSPQGLEDLAAYFRAPPLVVLDRDGVLNRTVPYRDDPRDSPLSPDQVELLPGVAAAVAELHAHGVPLAIATNQPSAAKGKATRAALEATHARVLELLPVKPRSFICWHKKEDGCECRKPKPRLLLDAAAPYPELEGWMVGDRLTDHQAGRAAGMRTALLGDAESDCDWRGADLPAFVRFLGAVKGW